MSQISDEETEKTKSRRRLDDVDSRSSITAKRIKIGPSPSTSEFIISFPPDNANVDSSQQQQVLLDRIDRLETKLDRATKELSEMKNIIVSIASALQANPNVNLIHSVSQIPFDFPLKSVVEVEEFNEWLKDNMELAIVDFSRHVDMSEIGTSIANLLEAIFSKSLAAQYSKTGQSWQGMSKRSFVALTHLHKLYRSCFAAKGVELSKDMSKKLEEKLAKWFANKGRDWKSKMDQTNQLEDLINSEDDNSRMFLSSVVVRNDGAAFVKEEKD